MAEDIYSRILDLIPLHPKNIWPREDDKNPNGWVKDEVLTDEIIKCLDSTEGPDYVYTIFRTGTWCISG